MSTDYDVPRASDQATESDSVMAGLGTLTVSRGAAATQVQEELELAENEPLDLPGFGLADEELMVAVVPRRMDEFTCVGCFLVQHKSRIARHAGTGMLCPDCA